LLQVNRKGLACSREKGQVHHGLALTLRYSARSLCAIQLLANEKKPKLMIGQTVSHYRILERIGEGGMGVVYLAEDTHLRRQVAIKFLSAANNQNYRARFLREARAISSVSHPHIAIIHDYGETPDAPPFIVMEYIKGETLSELLYKSGLTISRALEIMETVGEALSAAHARGIIHRDIKPSNVLVDDKGQVKVVDFGLVKHLFDDPPADDPDAATLPALRTSSNAVVGTPLYLSPEQATGAPVDARSDIFALGALLYEALTGRPAFSGGNLLEIGAQVIHVNPQPPSTINPRVSPELDRITLKALAKKAEDRHQSAAELVADLRTVRAELSTAEDTHHTKRVHVSRGVHSSALKSISETFRRPRVSLAFLVIIVLALGGMFWLIFRWLSSTPQVPFQNMQLTKLTNTGDSLIATISPDGKYLARVVAAGEKQSLVLSDISAANSLMISSPADVEYLGVTFSPDGRYLFFVRNEKDSHGQLYVVPTISGSARRLLSEVSSPVALSPNAKQIAFIRFLKTTGEYLLVVAQTDGTGERVLATRKNGDLLSLEGLGWSPDGTAVACAAGSYLGGFHMNVVQVQVASGAEKPVTSHRWFSVPQAIWLGDGSGLIVAAAEDSVSPYQIWHVSYPDGEVRRITNDANDYAGISLPADSKSIIAIQSNRQATLWLAPEGDANRAAQIASGVGITYGLALTPDSQVLYSAMANGKLDIWSIREQGEQRAQVTAEAGANYHPTVSRDGRYIFFASNRSGIFNIWRMNSDGSNPKQLSNGGSDFYPYPSPDGQWVIYQSGGGGTGKPTLWKVPVDGGAPGQLTSWNSSIPVVSPDGKQIACRYWDESSGTQRIALISSAGGPPTKIFAIPVRNWQRIRWMPDGSALTYTDIKQGVSNLWMQPIDGSAPKQLTNFRSDQIFSYEWSNDHSQLVCERGTETNDVVQIRSFQ
jgi:serine/threonine protein kinase